MSTYAPEQTSQVVYLPWEDYQAWLCRKCQLREAPNAWGEMIKLPPAPEPGQHDAMIGPTGEGKSTHAVGRFGNCGRCGQSIRKYVLALDPKGEDETLSQSGYARVSSIWPDDDSHNWREVQRWRWTHRADAETWDKVWDQIESGGDGKLIVGGPARNDREFEALKQLMTEAIAFCRYTRGWTLYVDEFEVVSSRDIFALGRIVNLMLITARRAGISVVTSYQAQAWVSKHAIRQARRAVMWPTGDEDMIANVARGMGRNWREVKAIVDELPPFHTATITRGKYHPVLITSAPKLGAKTAPVPRREAQDREQNRGASR